MSISQLFSGASEDCLPTSVDLTVESRKSPCPPPPPHLAQGSLSFERSLVGLRTHYATVVKRDRHADIDWWSLLNRRDLASLYATALSIQVASCRSLSPSLLIIEAKGGGEEEITSKSPPQASKENDHGIIWLNIGWLCREAQQGRPLRLVHPSLGGLTREDEIGERILGLLTSASHQLVLCDALSLDSRSLVAKRFVIEDLS